MKKMTNSAATAATGVILLIEGGEIVRGGGEVGGGERGCGEPGENSKWVTPRSRNATSLRAINQGWSLGWETINCQ